VPASMILTIL